MTELEPNNSITKESVLFGGWWGFKEDAHVKPIFQLRNTKQKCFSLSQTSHASFAKDVLMVDYDSVYLQGCDLDSSLLIWHILILTDPKAGVSTVNILTGLTVLAAGCCVFILIVTVAVVVVFSAACDCLCQLWFD